MTDDELTMLDECNEAEFTLTPWELDFIDSMEKIRHRDLTPSQSEKLKNIASKIDE